MVVTVLELELQLDPAEVRRGRLEGEAVAAGLQFLGEPRSPVTVGLRAGDDGVAPPQLYPHAAPRLAALGVENVRGERDCHCARTLRLVQAVPKPRKRLDSLPALKLAQRREARRRRQR